MLTDIIIALIGLLFFILLEWGYIYFARTLGLTAPALKGAKKAPAIGGGVIFYVAAAMGFDWLPGGWLTLSALLGLTLIAGISMADDIRPRGILSRLAVQIISVGLPMVLSLLPLALWENQPPALSWWLPAIIAAVFVVGFMNEFNFMDGIDGLTGLYSLVVLLTLTLAGIPWQFSAPLIASALAFCIFNFRKYSLCFAGDVGAVTMGAIIGSMIVCLPDPLTGLGCVAVYLTDASLTILTRWHAGKNIFQAHKEHLYQLLVFRKGVAPLKVAAAYAGSQAVIAAGLLLLPSPMSTIWVIVATVTLVCIWFSLHRKLLPLPELQPLDSK